MNQVENKTHKLDTAVRLLEDDLKQVEGETSELHNVVEAVDNKLLKNNPRLRGLKEGVEGEDFKTYGDVLDWLLWLRNRRRNKAVLCSLFER